jgi:hypothetical protein
MAKKIKTEDKLDNIYNTLIDRIEKVEVFTLEQAPDICKEIVAARLVDLQNQMIIAIPSILIGMLLLSVGAYCGYAGLTQDISKELMVILLTLGAVLGSVLGTIALICGSSSFLENLLEIREVKVSKKLTVLKGIRRLMK